MNKVDRLIKMRDAALRRSDKADEMSRRFQRVGKIEEAIVYSGKAFLELGKAKGIQRALQVFNS
jgi:hypothetical protein